MIEIKNINKYYDSVKVLENISFKINPKEKVVLWGPSGCGKTTLFNIICGLHKNYDGILENIPDKISCCFQEERLLESQTVTKNIEVVQNDQNEVLLNHLIEIFRLNDLKDKKVYLLSGGERQRVSIARALYYNADLILLDEAFKSLDSVLKYSIFNELNNLDEFKKRSVLFITHDIIEAYMTANRIISVTKSPARVEKIIKIKKPFEKRKITDPEINEYYNELII